MGEEDVVKPAGGVIECRAFQNGNCESGDACKFFHNPANKNKGDEIRSGRTLSAETMTIADVGEFYRGVLASELACGVLLARWRRQLRVLVYILWCSLRARGSSVLTLFGGRQGSRRHGGFAYPRGVDERVQDAAPT